MIRIPAEITEKDIEALLSQAQNQEIGSSLDLPQQLSSSATFGSESLLIQLVATWSRRSPKGALRPFMTAGRARECFEALCARPFGLAALCLAPRIYDSNNREVERFDALTAAIPWVTAMDSGKLSDTARGTSVCLMSVGNAQREYLKTLYRARNRSGIRSREDFGQLVTNILDVCLPGDQRRLFDFEATRALGNIIHELTKNTDDHARLDHLGNNYSRLIKGIIARNHLFSAEALEKYAEDNSALSSYLQEHLDRTLHFQRMRFFEISVFDVGPGLARRWTQKDYHQLTLDEELVAVSDCFELGKTTKDSPSSGGGLYSVWELLSQLRGFLRIRTGRLSLYKTFSGTKADIPIEFQQWKSADAKSLAPAEGLSVTILIPLTTEQ